MCACERVTRLTGVLLLFGDLICVVVRVCVRVCVKRARPKLCVVVKSVRWRGSFGASFASSSSLHGPFFLTTSIACSQPLRYVSRGLFWTMFSPCGLV